MKSSMILQDKNKNLLEFRFLIKASLKGYLNTHSSSYIFLSFSFARFWDCFEFLTLYFLQKQHFTLEKLFHFSLNYGNFSLSMSQVLFHSSIRKSSFRSYRPARSHNFFKNFHFKEKCKGNFKVYILYILWKEMQMDFILLRLFFWFVLLEYP